MSRFQKGDVSSSAIVFPGWVKRFYVGVDAQTFLVGANVPRPTCSNPKCFHVGRLVPLLGKSPIAGADVGTFRVGCKGSPTGRPLIVRDFSLTFPLFRYFPNGGCNIGKSVTGRPSGVARFLWNFPNMAVP